MNDLILQDSGALTISDSDRIRISQQPGKRCRSIRGGRIRGHGIGVGSGSPIGAYPSTIYPMN